jgi:hypothetical protein
MNSLQNVADNADGLHRLVVGRVWQETRPWPHMPNRPYGAPERPVAGAMRIHGCRRLRQLIAVMNGSSSVFEA